MKPKYIDILSRISSVPLWYDSNGAPRFDPFRPELCSNFYADEIILLKIQCQECKKPFLVEIHSSKSRNSQSLEYQVAHRKKYIMNPIHYGDPPRHNECIGDSMNAESLQIVEFWKRERIDWIRISKFEISF